MKQLQRKGLPYLHARFNKGLRCCELNLRPQPGMPNTSSAHQRTLNFWLRNCTSSQVEHSSYIGTSVIELTLVEFSIDAPEPSLLSSLI